MRIVIVGGGKVGANLAGTLREDGHGVIVIEPREDRAEGIAEDTHALVVVGDGTDVSLLKEVGVDRADIFLAVTGSDDVNLVACQLARTAFGCFNVIARLNDPKNRKTFDALEVPVVSVTEMIAKVISRELDLEKIFRIDTLGKGEVTIFEVEIPEACGTREVRSVELPPSSVLVAIRRGGTVLVPGATSELVPGDRVVAVTLMDREDKVQQALIGKGFDKASDLFEETATLEIEEINADGIQP